MGYIRGINGVVGQRFKREVLLINWDYNIVLFWRGFSNIVSCRYN